MTTLDVWSVETGSILFVFGSALMCFGVWLDEEGR